MADYIRETKANLNYTTDPKLAFSDVDLVIEAIHEKEEAKTRLFAKVDAHVRFSIPKVNIPKFSFAQNC